MSAFSRVLKLAELPSGTKKVVDVGGKPVLVCNVSGRLHAISNICSHAEKPLERGRIGNGWIACPAHGARFELATGKAINLPATKGIATYETRVVDEWIELVIPAQAGIQDGCNAASTFDLVQADTQSTPGFPPARE